MTELALFLGALVIVQAAVYFAMRSNRDEWRRSADGWEATCHTQKAQLARLAEQRRVLTEELTAERVTKRGKQRETCGRFFRGADADTHCSKHRAT